MHTNALFFGAQFTQALQTSPLPEHVKSDIKERCKQFLVEAVKEVEMSMPSTFEQLECLSS